jgi:hypothetical protein
MGMQSSRCVLCLACCWFRLSCVFHTRPIAAGDSAYGGSGSERLHNELFGLTVYRASRLCAGFWSCTENASGRNLVPTFHAVRDAAMDGAGTGLLRARVHTPAHPSGVNWPSVGCMVGCLDGDQISCVRCEWHVLTGMMAECWQRAVCAVRCLRFGDRRLGIIVRKRHPKPRCCTKFASISRYQR